MSHVLIRSAGGSVALPDPRTIMIDRLNGGQLVVFPARRVWDRTALDAAELTQWNFLVAATAIAMLDTLPQLRDGCINYWDAGNWALHPQAPPIGAKSAPAHRFLHQHLIGRSPQSSDPCWTWGESPLFPHFRDRYEWSRGKAALTPTECTQMMPSLTRALREAYGVHPQATDLCGSCGYPTPQSDLDATSQLCPDCSGPSPH